MPCVGMDGGCTWRCARLAHQTTQRRVPAGCMSRQQGRRTASWSPSGPPRASPAPARPAEHSASFTSQQPLPQPRSRRRRRGSRSRCRGCTCTCTCSGRSAAAAAAADTRRRAGCARLTGSAAPFLAAACASSVAPSPARDTTTAASASAASSPADAACTARRSGIASTCPPHWRWLCERPATNKKVEKKKKIAVVDFAVQQRKSLCHHRPSRHTGRTHPSQRTRTGRSVARSRRSPARARPVMPGDGLQDELKWDDLRNLINEVRASPAPTAQRRVKPPRGASGRGGPLAAAARRGMRDPDALCVRTCVRLGRSLVMSWHRTAAPPWAAPPPRGTRRRRPRPCLRRTTTSSSTITTTTTTTRSYTRRARTIRTRRR